MSERSRRLTTRGCLAMLALAPALTAQAQPAGGEVMTTVYGPPPSDLSGMPDGPEVDGIISARNADKMKVTAEDGTGTVIFISDATEIKGSKGLFGSSKTDTSKAALINGLPVTVKTARWGNGLVATQVRYKAKDQKIAKMIHNGTAQGFAEQTAATEALRSRMGDIDKYNIKATTNVYFGVGKSALSPQAKGELCATASQANAMDNALLLVVGYTDSTGSADANQRLSEQRAARVVNYLQQVCHWASYRMLRPTGMAEADPQASNSTSYGKSQNRRVSVNVLVSKAVDGM
ncbi:MAG: OmpA family protein [Novosphingobium sp.]|nr:OmpA family protein [Novosphingobium sp.]